MAHDDRFTPASLAALFDRLEAEHQEWIERVQDKGFIADLCFGGVVMLYTLRRELGMTDAGEQRE